MVPQKTLRTCEENRSYFIFYLNLETSVELNKCLKQIKLPIELYTCALFSELPSNISTMIRIMKVADPVT